MPTVASKRALWRGCFNGLGSGGSLPAISCGHGKPPKSSLPNEALTARMIAAIGRVGASVARDDAPALVVTHGGSLRALLTAVTGERPRPIVNAAVWRLAWDGAGERIVGVEELRAGGPDAPPTHRS